ncbi:hypothetical protein CDAR_28811 [Caerostris darwini]|uniref:Sushi domain-containing protein n=1 Tax=Caerostris darwini TaxID=1538125 RepID=A0AAV4Q5K5_9ARAC|nr:hypothetical protein CDAR_28811 [Caerostris darwini]
MGQECSVKCKSGYSTTREGGIKCNNMLQWILVSLPHCRPFRCPIPKLTRVLIFAEDCSSKFTGSNCRLACKEGGKFLKFNDIQCIKGTHWSDLPKCTCPPPRMEENIRTNHNCYKMLPGQKCFLSCKRKLFMITSNYIICQNNTKWSRTPYCKKMFCPKPVLKDTFIFKENCSSKVPGERCYISCKNKDYTLQDSGNFQDETGFIMCQNNTIWSALPKCALKPCTEKKLPPILRYVENCTAVHPGKKCLLECTEGGKLIGDNFITCVQGSNWTVIPTCTCPLPYLTEDLLTIEDCSNKPIGEKCHFKCKENLSVATQNFSICQNNTLWDDLPKCEQKKPCIKLKLQNGLSYKEDCSLKLPGESCKLECEKGGKIIGNEKIICLNFTQWTTLPKCACPAPSLSEGLFTTHDCSTITVDERCNFKCTGNFSLIGNNSAICQNNTVWTPFPSCKKIVCGELKLLNILSFKEDCSSKSPGEQCQLECKEGGNLIGPKSITCTGNTSWSKLPTCACPPPYLNETIITTEVCSNKLIGQVCLLKCTKNHSIPTEDYIVCQNDTRWSPLPTCRIRYCAKPKLPNILSFAEDCSSKVLGEFCPLKCKKGGELIGSDKIVCVNSTKWSSFPKCTCPVPSLPVDLLSTHDCRFIAIGERCNVKCKINFSLIGNNSAICQNNTVWSPFPSCKKIVCSELKLPNVLNFKEDCSSKSPGEQCQLKCKEGGNIIGSNYITCINNTSWSKLPKCSCPPPHLNKNIITTEDCSNKLISGLCLLKCTKNHSIPTENYIVCQNDTRWSPLPTCRISYCAKPKLTSILSFSENCSSKVVGESCLLKCKKGGKLTGSDKIVCVHSTKWSVFPKCTCPVPSLRGNLYTTEDCTKKAIGEKCDMKCKNNFTLIGKPFAICQNSTLWSDLPKCKKILQQKKPCIKIKLQNGLSYKKDCSSKLPGESCELECQKGGKIIGNDKIICLNFTQWTTLPKCACPAPSLSEGLFTTHDCSIVTIDEKCNFKCKGNFSLIGNSSAICQNNTVWTPFPSCKKITCNKLKLPKILSYKKACSSRFPGEKCQLKCKEGGNIIGSNSITCINNTSWSKLPKCSCPPPHLNKNIITTEDCSNKLISGLCLLKCTKNHSIPTENYIVCQNDTRWSPLPTCRISYCAKPKLTSILSFSENCSSKVVGESCLLKCKEGGKLTGSDKILCVNSTKWSVFPKCNCPVPSLRGDLYTAEDCTTKAIGEKCDMKCKNNFTLIGKPFAICQNSTLWSDLPKCEKILQQKKPCIKIKLQNGLSYKNDCSSKLPGESCKLECVKGGKIIGNDKIICLNFTQWTTLPKCACPAPSLSEGLFTTHDCSIVTIDEKCNFKCKGNFSLIGNSSAICQNNTVWTPFPLCKKITCNKLKLPKILSYKKACSSRFPGQKCQLKCKEGGNIIGSNSITCINKTSWSKLPKCSCPPPHLNKNIITTEDCSNKLISGLCLLKCTKNHSIPTENYIVCQNDTRWSPLPTCRISYCAKPKLTSILSFSENCSSKVVGESCLLKCKEGGKLTGSDKIDCVNSTKWSVFPKCTCPVPSLRGNLYTTEDCTKKAIGEKCDMKCKNNFTLIGKPFAICQNSTLWSDLPKCKKILQQKKPCIKIKLQNGLSYKNDCSSKLPGESCKLECVKGGKIIGNDKIICLNFTQWTTLPKCACPAPSLSEGLFTTHDCSIITIDEKCNFKCKGNFSLIGNSSAICQNNTVWTPFPLCKKITCSKLKLPKILSYKKACSSRFPGQKCQLKCKEGGNIIGSNSITCINKTSWSKLPKCSCPPPHLNKNIITTEDCSNKLISGLCLLKCTKNHSIPTENYIVCQNDTRWSPLPTCRISYCAKPKLTSILSFSENCSSKVVGESCLLKCKEGGKLTGSDKIVCVNSTKWSVFPKCTCPVPSLRGDIYTAEDCTTKAIGEKCDMKCKNNFTLIGKPFAICQNSTLWSDLPKCEKILQQKKPCIKIKLQNGLSYKNDCSSKLPGESCKLECVKGGKIIGNDKIICLNFTQWTTLPKCACPAPSLSEGLFTTHDCSIITIDKRCSFKCKGNFSLIGNSSAICQNNTVWTPFPSCKKITCNKLKLPKILSYKKACSSRFPGQKCQLKCKEGGNIIGSNSITCINKTSWSKLPKCSCPPPHLNKNIITTEDCSNKLISGLCLLKCTKNHSIPTENYIVCQNDTRWSPLPTCRVSYCAKPKLPSILSFRENCSSKVVGESCLLKCKQGGELIGSDKIVCVNSTKWSALPKCTCPVPSLPGDLFTTHDCKFIAIGARCNVKCKINFSLIGNNSAICQNNTVWSPFPSCKKIVCSELKLPNVLNYKEDCSSKSPGEKCQLECKEGGNLIGSNSINCINNTSWSKLPKCACPSPHLNETIIATEDCSNKLIGEACLLKCTKNYSIPTENYIVCQNDTRWSPLPTCRISYCAKPKLPRMLIFSENCSSKVVGESCRLKCNSKGILSRSFKINCLTSTKWSVFPNCTCPFPPVFADYTILHFCSRKLIGQKCLLKCTDKNLIERYSYIICQRNFSWSSPQVCGAPKQDVRVQSGSRHGLGRLRACDKKLENGLRFAEDCSSKSIGEFCKVECEKGGKMLGDDKILCSSSAICQNNTVWTPFPSCKKMVCNELKLPNVLSFKEDCSSKSPGEQCQLECKEGGNLIGANSVTCINNTSWSTLPKCTCPPPLLPENMTTTEDCSNKLIGDSCFISCPNEHLQFNIECLSDTLWSSVLPCQTVICIQPKLPNTLSFAEDCSSKLEGESCLLKCKEGGELIGSNKIVCVTIKEWSAFPNCICPVPPLTEDMLTVGTCKNKIIGETCYVTCKPPLMTIGLKDVICQENGLWGPLPTCRSIYCIQPKLPNTLSFAEDCSSKLEGESCLLKCKEGGELIGSNKIVCVNSNEWGAFPNCICPVPPLTEGMVTAGACKNKIIGETCHVSCTPPLIAIGLKDVICQENGMWGPLPTCRSIYCIQPKLPNTLSFAEDCSSKLEGESCLLKCKEGGELIGSNKIVCVNSNEWSAFPNCICPVPPLTEDMVTEGTCKNKIIGETCYVSCKAPFVPIGLKHVTCQENGRWGPLPQCKKFFCPIPEFPFYLGPVGDCSAISVTEKCYVTCLEGRSMVGSDYVTCQIRGTETFFSDFPICTCAPPWLRSDLMMKTNCWYKLAGQECLIKCKDDDSTISITCQKDIKWGPLPNIECPIRINKKSPTLCPTPEISETFEYTEDCASTSVDGKCSVKCRHGGMLIGNNYIKCTRYGKWSSLPDCTCSIPIFSNDLKAKENCDFVKRGGKCYVECKKNLQLVGENFISCQNNSKWGSQPKCVETLCSIPKLPERKLIFKHSCSNLTISSRCIVTCLNEGYTIGNNYIECLDTRMWSAHPNCTCPIPKIEDNLVLKENCSFKQPSEKCTFGCKKGYKIKGSNDAICGRNSRWNTLPVCVKVTCQNPTLDRFVQKIDGNCTRKKFGDKCPVSCKHGGHIIGRKFIECNDNGLWSPLPDCSCPVPLILNSLKSKTNCSFVKRLEKCFVECEKGFQLQGENFIVCQSNSSWSSLPRCIKHSCLPPNMLQSILALEENCTNKKVGEECKVRCKHGGNIIGYGRLKCLFNKTWSTLPDCTCPVPSVPGYLGVKENCSSKKRGEKCQIICQEEPKNTYYISCQNNTKWSKLPKCIVRVCPRPILRYDILNFEGNCASKTVGEKCRVTCKTGGKLIGEQFVECLQNLHWTSFPDCSCPIPTFSNNLKAKQNCDFVKRGDKCYVECENNLQLAGLNFISCQNNSKWSPRPKCVEALCLIPKLPEEKLIFDYTCSNLTISSKCYVTCLNGGNTIGNNYIECLDNRMWSAPPNCTCPTPKIEDNLVLKENCSFKKPLDKCTFDCKIGYKIKEMNPIICGRNSTWNRFPVCVKLVCPDPIHHNSILRLEGNCTGKEFGAKCPVSCKQGGHIIGAKFIECNDNGHWSPLPDCSCPVPLISNSLKSKTNCSFVKRLEKCFVECEKGFQLQGENFIVCQSNSSWSSLPRCIKHSCLPPNMLQSILALEENCTNKKVAEECKIRCKQGGNIIGHDRLKCLFNKTWSTLPTCTCPAPYVPGYLELKENCTSKKRGENCLTVCKEEPKIISQITCQNNTKWSKIPNCGKVVCRQPSLGYHMLNFMKDCAVKAVGEKCFVTCQHGGKLIGNNYINCTKDGTWSSFPDCTCPVPKLTKNLKFKENCLSKTINEKCAIACKEMENTSVLSIICRNNLTWSAFPLCPKDKYCPRPVLHNEVLSFGLGGCAEIKIGDDCPVTCAHASAYVRLVKCLKGFRWAPFPQCPCRAPALNATDVIVKGRIESCENKKIGEKCFIKCKESNLRLEGDDFILCQNDTFWSSPPRCSSTFCPTPNLQGTVLFSKSDCSGRDIGYECHLVCKNGGRIIGSGYIKCLPNYTWTSLPDCTCPVPHVTNNLEFKEDCSKKKVNEKCAVACKEGSKNINVSSYIACKENREWSSLPKCIKAFCKRPVLRYDILKFEGECAFKSVGEICRVSCKQGGKLMGENFVKCQQNLHWSAFPDCTCPQPVLGKDLKAKFGDCMSKKRGEKCFIECKDKDSKLIGYDFLLCRRNAKWGASQKGEWYNLPVCSESYCHPPNVAGTVVDLKETCSHKRLGDECQLLCKHGGSIIGNDRIKCLFNNSWSTLPDCTCSSPHIKGDLELKEECSLKQRGGRCAVGCRGKDTIHYITCQNNTMWSKMPKCGKFTWTCDVPELPVPLLSFEESWKECEFKDYGDICSLVCLGGSQMVGSGTLICQRNGEWTATPDCTCGTPILPFDFETKENCTYKKAGENCTIGCKDAVSVSSRDYIICVETRRWDFMNHVLECVKSFCTLPVIPQEILKFEENCMKRKVGGTCRLSCRAGGSMLSSVDYITCFPNDTWSTLPECTCPDPYVTEDLDILENCKKKKPNEVCAISCKNEVDSGLCENRKYCTHKMAGEICQVYCIGGGNIIGKGILTCQENGEWSPFPDCTCPTPVLTKDLEFREDCSHKRFNERCLVKCKHGLSMDKQYILCDNFRRWESLPVCEKPSCPLPILPDKNIVTYKEDCSAKKPGDTCHMICIQGGYAHPDASRIVCRQNLTWSKFKYPICSCGVPILTEALVFKEDCTSKWPSHFCLLGCKNGITPSKKYIICQNNSKWDSLPSCDGSPITCSNPVLQESILKFEEDCMSKKPGETCRLSCIQGGNLLSDFNFITCQQDFTWSLLPICACPNPILGQDLESKEDCASKRINEYCLLGCKNGVVPSKHHILCQEDTKWSTLPYCKGSLEIYCPIPKFNSRIYSLDEDCTKKVTGETCSYRCTEGGVIFSDEVHENIFREIITCEPDLTWSKIQKCTCPRPVLPEGFTGCYKFPPMLTRCFVRCEKFPERIFGLYCGEETVSQLIDPRGCDADFDYEKYKEFG